MQVLNIKEDEIQLMILKDNRLSNSSQKHYRNAFYNSKAAKKTNLTWRSILSL